MSVEVVLPKVDMDMESGVIAAWRVADGDFVRQGDILFEMETNKATMEVESPGTGTIRGLAAITGESMPVGTRVAWIERETSSHKKPAGPSDDAIELRATPLARRTAKEHNIDLAQVTGSGPQGRIVERDIALHGCAPTLAATAAALPPEGALIRASERSFGAHASAHVTEADAITRVPLNAVRRIVGERLSESMRLAPHFYLTAQIEMTALQATWHKVARDVAVQAGTRPSITVALARLVGRVLVNHRLVNSRLDADSIVFHDAAHIAIAMDRDGDLIVPVLRDAHSRTLVELTQEYRRLRDAVRSQTITPRELSGGTFTLSNLAMYGVDQFTAIINQPQSAILAIGRTIDTPVGRDGHIVLRPMASFSLSSDHRVVDGITAARFMSELRQTIENPAAFL